ncbi:IclR family transcriptional regulator [Microbacterium sp. NPDC058389]|uniref:IclR family transcriptional regulator n=1 Tax=Microbacterium sp. NPDC058389 TaxID=3346475 RepID=UPI00364BED61
MVQSVGRAFRLLRVIARNNRPMSLSDLARAIETSKPATYHLLRTLMLEGVIVRRPDNLYELGWGLWEFGSAVVRSTDLARVARFHLDHLAEQTGEAVLLSIRDGHSVIYLDRGQSSESFELVANTGRRSSLHANASGKVLLAFALDDFIEEILAGPLRAFTTNTITDPFALRAELARVREQGFAACWQEQELGMSSIGVPIRDYTNRVIAALTLAGPAARVNTNRAGRLVSALSAEADAISSRLGAAIANSN